MAVSFDSGTLLNLTQTAALVATLAVAATQLRVAHRSHKALLSMQVMASHRDVWSRLLTDEGLQRVTQRDVDLTENPPTQKEEFFCVLVMNHMLAVWDAHKAGFHRLYEDDFANYFRLPIPNSVWRKVRRYQPVAFVEFVEHILQVYPEDKQFPSAPRRL